MSDTQLMEKQDRETVERLEPAPRRRRTIVPIAIVSGVVALFVVIGIWVVSSLQDLIDAVPTPGDLAAVFEPEPYEEIGPVVISSIRDMSNLTTVETVQYTIVDKGTDQGWLEWARGDSLQLFAVARIGAGIDMSGISVQNVSMDDRGVVEITVPAAEIQYVSVDNEATQILDRETGLFTKGDPRLETDARQVAEEVLVQAAVDDGVLTDAEANARQVLTDFLLGLGYRDVVVEFAG
ncbi:MAG TPA: DUF4230 domain-containing protein [Acidimicrobiia bacterium]|nr:DUF4230 domain-containing protein [Acidimicrobiia bacterium]